MTDPDPRPDPVPAPDVAANPPLGVLAPVSPSRPGEDTAPVLVTDLASKTLAVKEGQTFLYSDLEGNLDHGGHEGLGLYSHDTRFLSHFRLTLSKLVTAEQEEEARRIPAEKEPVRPHELLLRF